MNAGELLQQFNAQLSGDATQLDAQILLAHALGRPRTWLLAHLDEMLSAAQVDSAQESFTRFQSGTPLPYILGHREFFNLDFDLTKDVLIPRPETELLVEKAIARLKQFPEYKQVADIGTGSGAIAVSIAANVPDVKILATDISPAALQVAKRNAQKFNVQSRIQFVECDLLPTPHAPSPTFNIICANLPYIPTETMRGLPIYGREPALALDGGPDGLEIFRRLFKLIPQWIAPRGVILLEIESTLGAQTLNLAASSFPGAEVQLNQDLAGKDRLLEIQTRI